MFALSATHQLSSTRLEALKTLQNACRATDGAVLPIYPHLLTCYRPGPASLFYYDKNKLIGFLALFHFYPHAAEISLFVHPSYRRQGIAKQLFKKLHQNIQSHGLPLKTLIISTPKTHNHGWLHQHAFSFDSREYEMACKPYQATPKQYATYSIQTANHTHIHDLHYIDKVCFDPNRPDPIRRLQTLLKKNNLNIFILQHQHEIIGQVHLINEKTHLRLTDFAVLPERQRQGFGSELLKFCLKKAYETQQKTIHLTVSDKNHPALKLYQNSGFQIYNTIDYYKRGFSLDSF